MAVKPGTCQAQVTLTGIPITGIQYFVPFPTTPITLPIVVVGTDTIASLNNKFFIDPIRKLSGYSIKVVSFTGTVLIVNITKTSNVQIAFLAAGQIPGGSVNTAPFVCVRKRRAGFGVGWSPYIYISPSTFPQGPPPRIFYYGTPYLFDAVVDRMGSVVQVLTKSNVQDFEITAAEAVKLNSSKSNIYRTGQTITLTAVEAVKLNSSKSNIYKTGQIITLTAAEATLLTWGTGLYYQYVHEATHTAMSKGKAKYGSTIYEAGKSGKIDITIGLIR